MISHYTLVSGWVSFEISINWKTTVKIERDQVNTNTQSFSINQIDVFLSIEPVQSACYEADNDSNEHEAPPAKESHTKDFTIIIKKEIIGVGN